MLRLQGTLSYYLPHCTVYPSDCCGLRVAVTFTRSCPSHTHTHATVASPTWYHHNAQPFLLIQSC